MKEPGTPAQLRDALIASGDYDESFCDEACLMRYLRARSMDVTKAHTMLKATLAWRKESRVDSLTAEEFADCKYLRDGWMYVDGNDAEGRAVVTFRKRRDKLPLCEADAYLRFMMFTVETAIKNMKNGQDRWIFILDMTVYSPANAPALSTTLSVLHMLANHYPERLHKAYIVNAPAVFQVAYKVVYPFVDPVSRSKVEFVNPADYRPKVASSESTWSTWASSVFSSSSSKTDKAPGVDAAVVVDDGALKGPGTFAPFMSFFDQPFELSRQEKLHAQCW